MTDFFAANQGLVRFDRFMQAALYHPVHGYYSRGDRVFGAQGDFVTAPEISPLFGQTLAQAIAPALPDCGGHIWEFGAGRGLLARDLMLALGDAVSVYHIVDVSGALQTQQRETLTAAGIDVDRRVRWESTLPDSINGIMIGNEVLDAMPVRVFRHMTDGIMERHVELEDGQPVWRDLPADEELTARVLDLCALTGPWPDGYTSEWPEQMVAFAETTTRLLTGLAIFIDYGFGRSEFYHPQRSTGTLVAHHRHQMHDEVLARAGEQDITAHVDFTAVYEAMTAAGGELLGYTSQAAFLLASGLTELAETALAEPSPDEPGNPQNRNASGSAVSAARLKQAVQTLVSPSEMGELFKVMVWSRGVNPDAWPLTRLLTAIDRSRQL